MLAIPRPRTRGDCLAEARPCPWVGCAHHLLLERSAGSMALAQRRPPGGGRRQHLHASAPEALVLVWIDDALERLQGMEDSCALDVADRGGATVARVARLMELGRRTTLEAQASGLGRGRKGAESLKDDKP